MYWVRLCVCLCALRVLFACLCRCDRCRAAFDQRSSPFFTRRCQLHPPPKQQNFAYIFFLLFAFFIAALIWFFAVFVKQQQQQAAHSHILMYVCIYVYIAGRVFVLCRVPFSPILFLIFRLCCYALIAAFCGVWTSVFFASI